MATSVHRSGSGATTTQKPIPRRPTLVRKRNDDDEAPPSRPGKRSKVTFDSDVEIRVMNDSETAPEIIQEEVRRAFEKHRLGDPAGYNKIKDVYNSGKDDEDAPSATTLRNYTLALLGKVSSLDRSCSDLVHEVLHFQWLGRPENYVTLHVRLLASLVSVQGSYLGDTLRMLINNLTASPPCNGHLPSSPDVSRSKLYLRVHKALQYLLRLIPSASRVLSSVLVSVFPHQTDSRQAHTIYVRNLLKLLGYAPELRADVLALITERLVKIDVEVQVDMEDLTEEARERLVADFPQIRPDLLDDVDEMESDEESESDEDDDDEAQRTKDIIRKVEKMDSILDILFSHYNQSVCEKSMENQIETIETLFSQFVTIILPTHRSRHTQFLLFHFVQMSPSYIDHFVGHCVHIAFDRARPAVIRQAAAAYLASFVARGIHVPSNIVRDVFDYIGGELERLRRENEPKCLGPDLSRYSSFYCLVQALLYIFCFRWRDLQSNLDDDEDDHDPETTYGHNRQWKAGVKDALTQNLFSKLNPLKVCSPAIVTEFARVANYLGVVYIFHMLETNKRIRLSHLSGAATSTFSYGQPSRETALSASMDESYFHLDAYFPFDPYHLPKSKRWIEGDYREWEGIPGLDDDQASESGSDEEEADSDEEEGTETDETRSSL